jgi:hypothetical protein
LASIFCQKAQDGLPLGFVYFLGQQLSVVLDIELSHRSVHEGLPGQLSGMRHYQQRRMKQTGFIGAQEKI